jgi:hypothetical protein
MSILRLALIALSCSVLLPADLLTLRNGSSVEGNYLGGTAREIRMEVGNRVQTFSIDTVSGVQFSSGNPQYQQQPGAQQQSTPPGGFGRSDAQSSSSNYPPQTDNNSASNSGLEIPAGTQLTVRMIDSVDSEASRMGDTFRASIDEPVTMNGQTVIPRGADVVARLVDDQKSGKIQGRTVLKLVLTSVTVNGRPIDISTQDVVRESSSRGARSAKVIGGTTALGAVLGGIAGGGRGAAIGAGSGAAVGTGAQVITAGQRVRIPSESRLVFTLLNGVRI